MIEWRNDKWMNEWMTEWMINEWWMNCLWESVDYVWTLRPTALKRSLKNSYLNSFIFKDLTRSDGCLFSKTSCLYIKRSFISKTFLCLSFGQGFTGLHLCKLKRSNLTKRSISVRMFHTIYIFICASCHLN